MKYAFLVDLGFVYLIICGTSKLLRMGSRDNRLPPGPPTMPILENLGTCRVTMTS